MLTPCTSKSGMFLGGVFELSAAIAAAENAIVNRQVQMNPDSFIGPPNGWALAGVATVLRGYGGVKGYYLPERCSGDSPFDFAQGRPKAAVPTWLVPFQRVGCSVLELRCDCQSVANWKDCRE